MTAVKSRIGSSPYIPLQPAPKLFNALTIVSGESLTNGDTRLYMRNGTIEIVKATQQLKIPVAIDLPVKGRRLQTL